MIVTLLGTGTSFGVPQVGCGCAVCHSDDPRDRRSRCAAFVRTAGGTRLLIDTPPELRLQLVAARINAADAVLYTHEHADHIHGIDDLRALSVRNGGALPLYGSRETLDTLRARFPYVVDPSMRPLPGTTKPEGTLHEVHAGERFVVGDAEILPLAVPHGRVTVLAYRIGRFGYVTDAKSLPAEVIEALRGVDVLVLNALFRTPHPTHLSIPEAVAVAQTIGARQTYFTHLTHDHGHAALAAELPDGIAPAYDGLEFTIAD
ncbi:MAG: MBL fold metallo-hydrolase [Gemmatimonadaceae bacterium]|nr:MBL fold metallo-hydrolase [Gemmatimonadaceae bacterium]